jgi:dipeptidyl aminopeptidase/acylaminoacyl peptidase
MRGDDGCDFNVARRKPLIKTKYGIAILASTGLAFSVAANTDWDNPDDIPVIEPVVVGLAGEQPADIVRYLMARGALQTRISPDGKSVAFSTRVTGEPQLWVVNATGGWPRQLTFGSAITFFRWSPDSRHLLVGRDSDGNEREGYNLLSVDGTTERQLLPKSAEISTYTSPIQKPVTPALFTKARSVSSRRRGSPAAT